MEFEIIKGKHTREIPTIGNQVGNNIIISEDIAVKTNEVRKKSYWKIKCLKCECEY